MELAGRCLSGSEVVICVCPICAEGMTRVTEEAAGFGGPMGNP